MRSDTSALLLTAFLLACATQPTPQSAVPQQHSLQAQPIPAHYQSDVSLAEKLGRAIYRYDRAAWVATDAFLERFPSARTGGMRGWIVVLEKTQWVVTFVSQGGSNDLAAYQVTLDADLKVRGVLEHRPPIPLGSNDRAMFRARQLALQSTERICPTHYNTVVVPASLIGSAGWLVYLLPVSTVPGEEYLGHHRVLVNQEGTSILRSEALSKTCLRTPPPPPNAVAAWVTHLTSPTPIDIHVFRSLASDRPLYVGAGGNQWLVTDATIEYLGPLK
jgi:hypothetical protein